MNGNCFFLEKEKKLFGIFLMDSRDIFKGKRPTTY